jgi:hypothetical protein
MHTVRQLDNNGVVGSSVALGPSIAEDGLEASSDSAVSWMGSEHSSSPYSLDYTRYDDDDEINKIRYECSKYSNGCCENMNYEFQRKAPRL